MILAFVLLLAASATFEDSFRAGLLALQRNDLAAAETNLEEAARLGPNDARVWVALARTYWKRGQRQKADGAAAKAATLAPRNGVILSNLAIYFADSGQPMKAAEAQTQYSLLAPNDEAARKKAEALYFDAVRPLLDQQKFGEAIGSLAKATAQLPNSAQLELALGVAYYGMRRFDEAAGAFLKTIAIAPEIDQPYVFLGRFLGQIPAKMVEVTKAFVEFQASHPASPIGYLLHAKALNTQSKEPETARTLLEKAISLDERSASAHFELGVALERLQRFGEAAREFERAAVLEPNNSVTHYRLSRLYDRLGKPEAAQRERETHAKLVAVEEAAK